MISPHPLERLVEQETFGEMLALLQPEELIIAFLRLEGLTDDQIAALLDIDRATVFRRMELARQRLMQTMPELEPVLRDRRHAPLHCRKPLERGWVCPTIGGEPVPQEETENGEPSSDDSPHDLMPRLMVRAETG